MVTLSLNIPSVVSRKQPKLEPLTSRAQWWDILHALWFVRETGTKRILLAGPPGTGKSTTAQNLLNTNFRVTMTEGTAVEDLLGCFQLRKQNEKDKSAVTEWVDGPVPRAMKNGCGVLIDEIDKMPPEIQSLAYAVMDDKPQVMLPTGEMVDATNGYGVVATTNANISVLPEALIDRFDAVLVAVTPHEDAIAHLPPPEKAAVQNYYKSLSRDRWLWTGKTTVRRMRSFHTLKISKVFPEKLAADCVFGKSGAEIISVLATAAKG